MLAYLYSVAVGASGGDVITNISLSVRAHCRARHQSIVTSMQPLWGIINIFGLAPQLHAKLSTDKLHTFGLCCAATACPSACPSISSHCLPFQQYHQHYLVALGSGSSQPAYQLFPWRIFSGYRADMAPICFHCCTFMKFFNSEKILLLIAKYT